MAATSVIKFTNVFEDGTTSDLTVGEIEYGKVPTSLKTDIKNFNASMESSQYPDLLVSKTGAKWKRIGSVQVITTQREYIF